MKKQYLSVSDLGSRGVDALSTLELARSFKNQTSITATLQTWRGGEVSVSLSKRLVFVNPVILQVRTLLQIPNPHSPKSLFLSLPPFYIP
jgi:hypothetical protein